MPRYAYETWKPGQDALDIIEQAETICVDYAVQGYDLTLRQLYYQFVSRALIPNSDKSYKRLGSIINKARLAGLLDWRYIVDRTRNVGGIGYYRTPEQWLIDVAAGHTVDHWEDQATYFEVWVEKEALAGVVERAASAWDVPYFSCRGYVSQSELWGAAQRLRQKVEEGKRVIVLHLGDHDPSGIDMTRDITDRLDAFICTDWHRKNSLRCGSTRMSAIKRDMVRGLTGFGDDERVEPYEVRRIALNWDQVQEYDPPPNPAKLTDSRVGPYLDRFGGESWELDALEPRVLDDLIQANIRAEVDEDAWAAHDVEQERERAQLRFVADRWDAISAEYDEDPGE